MTGTASPQLDGRTDVYLTYAALSALGTSGVPIGTRANTSDLGPVYFDGVAWALGGSRSLMVGAIPLVVPGGTATIGATGTLTTLTSMATYSAVGQPGYFYLPANYLATVSAAGWYYGTFASATSVTVYNYTWSGIGLPSIPASPPAFAGLAGGSGTQQTTAVTVTCTIPAGVMQSYGQFDFKYLATYSSSGNNKTISSAFGALNLFSSVATTTTSQGVTGSVRNAGTAKYQTATLTSGEGYATATQVLGRGTVDTTAAVNYVVSMTLANAGDYVALESYNFAVNSI